MAQRRVSVGGALSEASRNRRKKFKKLEERLSSYGEAESLASLLVPEIM